MKNIPELGFGMMRLPLTNPDQPALIDIEQTKQMVDTYLEAGGTYFDTAFMYHDGQSEAAAKTALVDRHPRDSFRLATKLPLGSFETHEDMVRIFEGQFTKCGVEYFDRYLAHNVNGGNYEQAQKLGAFEFLEEQKAKGRIKHLGFSFHDDADFLEKVLKDHPDAEFVQLQVNYLDWEDPAVQARRCVETVRAHDKDILVMEPIRGGRLAQLGDKETEILKAVAPDLTPAQLALRFVNQVEGVVTILSGMSTIEQVRQNIETFENMAPLTDAQMDALRTVAQMIRDENAIPCTGCNYCEGCPVNIPISRYFALYNENLKRKEGWDSELMYYQNAVGQGYGKAEDCIECRRCEQHCPQHIEISARMKDVSKQFDGRTQ